MGRDKILIRRMKKSDAEAIGKIDAAITKAPSLLDFKQIVSEEIKRAVDTSYVAEIKGKVVGFMISYMTYGNFGAERCAWIAMFGVDPKWMGQGIGKRLAEEIFRAYKEKGVTEVFTSVRWDATDILSFFKTLGFERSNFINLWKKVE
ncbi:MAG: GNAT family N-acetyltransferase [Deltaproteobacteria bacterium]|nr:GNAT family N-acetyltransferase [Deltaproteobacteria bacterium]